MTPPKASVVVLTRDAGPPFDALLHKLSAQNTDFEYEILVVDSGSTDGTPDLARRYGATVHTSDPATFDHGATRNLGASYASGEYLAFLVQDALPEDDRWLAAMVEALDGDGRVAGVYSRQLPRPESGPLTRVLVNGWATAAPERRTQFAGSRAAYNALPPQERLRLAAFDNVSSCVRRSVWEEHPFERTRFGEDLRWGKAVVEAGYTVVYEPASTVRHSHERGALYDLRRHYVHGALLAELFDLFPKPWRPPVDFLLSAAYLYRRLRRRGSVKPLRAAFLGLRYSFVAQAGTVLGASRGWLSRTSPRLATALDRRLSRGV